MPITTKWPRLLVVGEPVTEAQADEILIRTDSWYLGGNDREWERTLHEVAAEFGWPPEPDRRTSAAYARIAQYRAAHEWQRALGILELGYLHNARIASSWVGGPHGWCDWSGRIGCSTFNVGKWPSSDEITDDWQAIAEAFPYLDLTAQLVDDEGEGTLAGQWRVKNGAVEHDPEPAEFIAAPSDDVQWMAPLMVGGERGCTIDRFRSALARVVEQAPPVGEPAAPGAGGILMAATDWHKYDTPEAQIAFANAQARLDEGDYPDGEAGRAMMLADEALTDRYDALVLGPAQDEFERQCDEEEFARHYPEPPDGGRVEFEYGDGWHAAYRQDQAEGNGDWWLYGDGVECYTWRRLIGEFDLRPDGITHLVEKEA